MTPNNVELIARCRGQVNAQRHAGFTVAANDLQAITNLAESLDSELSVERQRRDLYRREAALACSAAQEALPLAIGALEQTVKLADPEDWPILPESFAGHIIGLRSIAQTVRAAALRCEALRPYLPPSPTA